MALNKDEKHLWKRKQKLLKRKLLKGKKLRRFEIIEIRKLNIKREENLRVKVLLYIRQFKRWLLCKF